MNKQDREAIEKLLAASSDSDGEFVIASTEIQNSFSHLFWIAKALWKTRKQPGGLNLVLLETKEGQRYTIAITGNGPHSQANAELLATAPRIIRELLKEIDKPSPFKYDPNREARPHA